MRIVNEIIGKEVLDSSAVIIGKVKDVEIDDELYTVEAIVLNFEFPKPKSYFPKPNCYFLP